MPIEPQGKRGRPHLMGQRPHTFSTSLDDEEFALFERALRRLGRESFTGGHKARLAMLEWARYVLAEEGQCNDLNPTP
jgi:hypothetical protein